MNDPTVRRLILAALLLVGLSFALLLTGAILWAVA